MELALFIVVAFVLYGSTVHGDWLFDDFGTILGNTDVMGGKWKQTAFGNTASEWRAPVRAAWALGVKIWGEDPFHFHVGNILIHAVNSWIVMRILTTLGFDAVLSLVGGLIFVGHPLAVSAVAYMSSRAVLMSATFGFLAIWAVLAGYEILAIPALALAVLSKEDAIVLCATLGLVCLMTGSPWFALFFALPVGAVVWRWTAIRELLGNTGASVHGALPRLEYGKASFTETVLRYPQWLCGAGLNNDPDIRPVPWRNVVFALGLVAPVVAAFLVASPLVQLALILICVSPLALYWFVVMPDPVMEYRAYISLLGATLLLTVAASMIPLWTVVVGLAWLWAVTGFRAFDFTDAKAFWLGCMRDGSGEKPRVLINLGGAHHMRNELDQAKPYFERALKLNPRLWVAWANLGLIAAAQNRESDAQAYFQQAEAAKG